MFHLTVRVPWHDSRWNGTVCQQPSCNSFCVALDRIRENRDDDKEDSNAGKSWDELGHDDLPACKAESGAFMNGSEWTRRFEHPYANIQKVADTHGHLKPTQIKVPPYSTFAVPFAWMLKDQQESIDKFSCTQLPPDEESPFNNSPWIFGRDRQKAILDLFSSRLTPEKSLAFFYSKEGQPVDDTIPRLVMGVGRITNIAKPNAFAVDGDKPSYLMWDLPVRHSIRPDDSDGFLLPYHDYLEPTGDVDKDERREALLKEIMVPVDPAHFRAFSYGSELASSDIALSTLVRCLEAVRKIKEHGIAEGPWERREEWLNRQIALAWQDRGAFPGLGSVLEAVGMRLGTALALELLSSGTIKPDDDPWPIVHDIICGKAKPPQDAYISDLEAIKKTWNGLVDERRNLLKLLSRFSLTRSQAIRWFEPAERNKGTSAKVSDKEILENPYRICEVDLGDRDDAAVSIGTIDRGLLPDPTIAKKHPVPKPSNVESQNDHRRLRAALVTILRDASERGDALLDAADALQHTSKLDLAPPCVIGSDWPKAHHSELEGIIDLVDIAGGDSGDTKALQLSDLKKREDRLRAVLGQRAGKLTSPIKENWKDLLIEAITESGSSFDRGNKRHMQAIEEQAKAVERLLSRRLTVLVGRAGTGKTSVMGALVRNETLKKDGILFLAPTGKARVRLGQMADDNAKTVAQFLNQLGRYDRRRQRPKFEGKEKYRKDRTIIVDECSMLNMDDLAALLEALDLAHVQRLILVGDPNQLPPIGVGRPFADLASYLDSTDLEAEGGEVLSDALVRLTVEVRSVATGDEPSDTLRLASWFTGEPQPVDADRMMNDLDLGEQFNDLDIRFWKTPGELRSQLLSSFKDYLDLQDARDVAGFDKSLGIEGGMVDFSMPEGSENWQILSPVRMHPYGVHEINRWIQRQFRGPELEKAAEPWGVSLGDESIVRKDKVIQTRNENRDGFNWPTRTKVNHYIANGEVGLAATYKKIGKNHLMNIAFSSRPHLTFGYGKWDFPQGAGPLQLAYALTVHKSQGSEFKKVFVVIPEKCRTLSRELLYTALTRSSEQLVLLIEGDNATSLFDLSRPEKSETSRRNTNIFQSVIRSVDKEAPYAEHLIHRTEEGHLVRSKSELVIANILSGLEIPYSYECPYEGSDAPGRMHPDFSFETAGGDLIIWEHLGMLSQPDYRRGWEWKKEWYEKNGFVEGKTLFTSVEDDGKGLDSSELRNIAKTIKKLLS